MIDGAGDLFKTTTFNELYLWVRAKRQEFGMSIDDDISFDESKDVITRFRKVVGTMSNAADECRDWDELLAMIQDRMEKMEDVPNNRNEMVFFAMRNEWVVSLYNYVMQMTQEGEEDV